MLDVSSTAKERPGGGYVYIYHNPERPLAWQGSADTYLSTSAWHLQFKYLEITYGKRSLRTEINY